MKTCTVTSLIYEIYCPHCNIRNYIEEGAPEDMSQTDSEGLVCWQCKKESVFEGVADFHELLGNDLATESLDLAEGVEELK